MPEEFIRDPGVPARWKVLALVQGFWIAGKTAFATNDWIQKKLGYSRRQVQNALKELEDMDLIVRNVQGMSRIILPGGAAGLRGGRNSQVARGAAGVHHNSVSNSERRGGCAKSASATLQVKESQRSMEYVDVDEDGRESPRRAGGLKPEGKNKVARRLQFKFAEMCEKQLGTKPVIDMKGYRMCLYAMNTGGLTEDQVVDLFDEWFKLGKADDETISITRALSARQIEGYKVRNGVK